MMYEYYCKACGVVTEENRRVRDRNNPCTCGACGEEATKQMSTSAFHLKGNCWAKDNYASKNATPPGYGGVPSLPRGKD